MRKTVVGGGGRGRKGQRARSEGWGSGVTGAPASEWGAWGPGFEGRAGVSRGRAEEQGWERQLQPQERRRRKGRVLWSLLSAARWEAGRKLIRKPHLRSG